MTYLRFLTFTFWNSYVLKLLSLETLTFSDVTLSDMNVVWCYVLSQYRIVCIGQERPKCRKGTLRPDFQANTRPSIFFKTPMSPQDAKRQLWKNPGIVSLKQFRDNEAWIQLGQESPLVNKKGLISRKQISFLKKVEKRLYPGITSVLAAGSEAEYLFSMALYKLKWLPLLRAKSFTILYKF